VVGSGEVCDDGDTVTEPCDTTDVTACLSDCSLLMASCGNGSLDPGEACDDGDADSFDACTTSCTVNDHHIGAPCRCTGSGCSALDFTAGTITGCSAMSGLEDSTRTLGCVRSSYDSTYSVSVYGAEGYCTLMAISCTGSWMCVFAPTTGDVSRFACPSGYVVATETRVELGMTITTKSCMVACTSDRDCRWNAEELSGSPWYPGCGEWRCIPRGDGGAYICGDDRNYTP
jgi:cysteine-rich repeat protein